MSNADFRGRFVWHELMTTDSKAAAAFYPKVTGWKTQSWEKDPSYTLWVGGKGPFGGVRTLPDATRAAGPHWLAYIGTTDVDAAVQSAQGLGARVLMGATDIPETGRFAVLADPQGAAFALFSPLPLASPQSGGGSMPQDFTWHELTTTDAAAAMRFYSQLFGWQEVGKHDMGSEGVYHLIGINGVQSIGVFQSTPGRPMPTAWMCYAQVADIDKAANAVKAAGGKIKHGPMEVPGGTWIAILSDPQGAAFAVHAEKRAATASPAAQPTKVTAPQSVSAASSAKSQSQPGRPEALGSAAKPAPARPAATAQVRATAKTPVTSAGAKKASAKKRTAKKAPAKKAPAKKSSLRKRRTKKAGARRGPQRKAKRAVRKVARRVAKRKSVKKRGRKSAKRARGSFAVARRFAAKQADSLLKRLRGKKRR